MKTILSIALLILSFSITVNAVENDAVFKYINTVAFTAFPKGTRSYDLYYVRSDSVGDTSELSELLKATKKNRVRWVVASLDAIALKAVLLEVFGNAESSEEIQTELVVVSPITDDNELMAAGRLIGADVEFLYLQGVVEPADEFK